MSTQTKRELLVSLRQEYVSAGRKRKQELLDGLVAATGYNRKYAISLLNNQPADVPRKRNRTKIYDTDVASALKEIWIAANCICPKRFIPFLPSLLDCMERFGHLELEKKTREKLLSISASTAERMLRAERKKAGRGRSLTRPGSLLKKQVAVKTFTKWDDHQIGFFEIDLVAHCGETVSGKFVNTLTMTDIATGWTELFALLCKSEDLVRSALDEAGGVLPFRIQGVDTDNGSEFLNHGMVSWCNARNITFTRSRAYRKNDQAHVEEKNGSVVRRLVGYDRFEGSTVRTCLAELYGVARLYINYFQPSMKLIGKTRDGAKVSKRYDEARTPLERLLEFDSVPNNVKKQLQLEYKTLDPLALLAQMAALQKRLWNLSTKAPGEAPLQAQTQPKEIPLRAMRKRRFYKRPEDTPSSKIFAAVLALPLGAAVEAKDFYHLGSIHFVNVALYKILKRDRLLARPLWGKYIRIDPNEADHVESVTRKLRSGQQSRSAIQAVADRDKLKAKKPSHDNKDTKNEPAEQLSIREHALQKKSTTAVRVAITKDFVKNAVCPTQGQIIYRDSNLIGFGLRLTAGSKSYVVEARVRGKPKRITIGRADLLTVKEARAEALQLLRIMKTQ